MRKTSIPQRVLLSIALWSITYSVIGQVGVGTTNPDASAALDVSSTSRGLLPPRLTRAQIVAITSPAEGLMVYCTDCFTKGLYIFNGQNFANGAGTTTLIETVTGAGGAVWLDRNLGASQVATSLTDSLAFGGYYQWGRNTDGHQLKTSNTMAGPVSSGAEGDAFITAAGIDWLITEDSTRWNGTTKGIHDPCLAGFRVPTEAEWEAERLAWSTSNEAGAFSSPLKLSKGGFRTGTGGEITLITWGFYWTSSTTNTFQSRALIFLNTAATFLPRDRFNGMFVRCIKE